jgi:hypothetical protein
MPRGIVGNHNKRDSRTLSGLRSHARFEIVLERVTNLHSRVGDNQNLYG